MIVRRDSIDRSYCGGWNAFLAIIPNQTLCTDGEIVRVGFLDPDATSQFIDELCQNGLICLVDGKCVDIAVMDQQRGAMNPCGWLEFANIPFGKGGGRVSACWLYEGPRLGAGLHMRGEKFDLHTPAGWKFEGSLSQNFVFVPLDPDTQARH